MDEDLARDLLEAVNELRGELRRARREGLVVRLSEAERQEIARQVFERVDERLAPAELRREPDTAPRPRQARGRLLGR